jgi:hypothetical protein
MTWVEHGYPTRWRWRRHSCGHTHTHWGHVDRAWSWHRRESGRWRRWRGQSTSELPLVGASKPLYGGCSAISNRGRPRSKRERIVLSGLRSQESFGGRAMALTLSIFLECILNGDGLVHEELSIHRFNGCVSGFEICVRHKSVTLGLACLWISRDLI